MDGGGWVKLWRKIFDSPGMDDPWIFKLFLWCVAEAQFKDDRVSGLKRGQFHTTGVEASRHLRVGRSKWYRGLVRLVELENITIQTDNHRTTITICNYDTYQPFFDVSEQPLSNGRTTDGQPSLKEECKEREEAAAANSNSAIDPPVAEDAANDGPHSPEWLAREWVHYRRGAKGRDELERATETFEEMLRHHILGAAILDEIRRKERVRTEPIWDFQNRLMGKPNGKPSSKATISDSAQSSLDWANRKRAENGSD